MLWPSVDHNVIRTLNLTWVIRVAAGVARNSLEVRQVAIMLREEVFGTPLQCVSDRYEGAGS